MNRSPWQATLDVVRRLPNYTSLSMIELGCGDARIVETLASEGCRIRGTTFLPRERDHVRSREHPTGLSIDHDVDLTKPLRYEDGAFDLVFCLEVLEHLEVHSILIVEIGRILKPGGFVILTSPNLGRMISRLHFAATGVHLTKERRPTSLDSLETMGAFHIRCIDFPVAHWLLWQNGLRIIGLEPTHVTMSGCLASWLAPFAGLFVRRALQRHLPSADDATLDLVRWMRTRAYARSEHLCIVARKVAAPMPGHRQPAAASRLESSEKSSLGDATDST